MNNVVRSKASACKAVGLAVMLTASALPLTGLHAAAATGGDTVLITGAGYGSVRCSAR